MTGPAAPQQRNPLDVSLERLEEALARSRESTALVKDTSERELTHRRCCETMPTGSTQS